MWLPSATRAGCSNSISTVRRIDWKVKVRTATVPAGPVVLQLVNGGQVEHALEVEGQLLNRRTAPIAAGAEGKLNLTLTPGRYELYCPVGNGAHKQAGMKTAIKVTAEESAPSSTY